MDQEGSSMQSCWNSFLFIVAARLPLQFSETVPGKEFTDAAGK